MGWEAWFTVAVVVGLLALLATERVSAATGVIGAVVIFLIAGVIDPAQAFSGFSNPAPITVAALYVLAGAVEETGALTAITDLTLGRGGRERSDLARLIVPTAAASGFLNNTPIVQVLSGQVVEWSRRTGRAASKLLLPMNYAAVLGGLITLIGTSTNLLLAGLMSDAGLEPLGLFEITKIGIPVAAAGVLVIWLTAPLLLPERGTSLDRLGEEAREFTVELDVIPGGPLAGITVRDAGLRDLAGVFLVQIERGERVIAPVGPEETLDGEDRLTFAGNVAKVLDLQRMRGLRSAEEPHFMIDGGRSGGPQFFEAVISRESELVGRTLKDIGFRNQYGGAVVAIHRAGMRVPSKLGEVELRPADVLLVLADPGFRGRWLDRGDFLAIAPLDGSIPVRQSKAPIVGVIAIGIVVLAGSGLLPILHASLAGALLLVVLGVLSPNEAKNSLDLNVLAVIAGSFGLGAAITESGLAAVVADGVVGAAGAFGDLGVLAGILVATVILTEVVSNNAAAALMFPVALGVATQAGIDPRALIVAVAVGASAGFLTPIGYQTNMLVYGLGGYRFRDFIRAGAPLTLTVLVVGILVIPRFWPL